MLRNLIFKGWLTFFCPMLFLFLLAFSVISADYPLSDTGSSVLTLPREICSMRFVDAEVKDVLRLLAMEYKLNLIISEKVAGLITLDFNQVPLEDLFFSILKTAGLGYTLKGDVILIATRKELREEETERVKELEKQRESEKKIMEAQAKITELVSKTVKVKYILNTKATESIAKELDFEKEEIRDLTQLADALRKMLSGREGSSIEVVDAANALIIVDVPERVEQIVALVEELDVPSPQISVEAKITLVDSDYARELGIQWGGRYEGSSGNTVISGTPLSEGTGASGENFVVNLPATVGAGQGGAIGFFLGDLNNDFLDVQLSALEDEGRVKVLASPRVITQDNQKAYIKIGDEIPFVERTVASGVITTELKFKDAAIELEVTPHTVDDEIFLDLVVARKTADFARSIEGNPPLRAQALTTKVSVSSGQTFVVGGLGLEEETKSTSAVPFFSRIPGLGWLFKHDVTMKTKRELIIFITPSIIGTDDRGDRDA